MRAYLILTRSITGLSGNPRYVNNKCKLLKESGWKPIVIWNYNSGEIELEHVKSFRNNVLHELQFFPCWYSKRVQDGILNQMMDIVGCVDELVIESNKLQLAAWGELFAKKYKIKHVIFITSEGVVLRNKASFDFFYSKLRKGEFFAINEGSVRNLFKNFTDIENPRNYCWSASPGVEVQDIPFLAFEKLPPSDYTISHFGRYKSYFPKMLEEIKQFVSQYQDKSFNLFFLGDVSDLSCYLKDFFMGLHNVRVFVHPPLLIIPKCFFEKSHIVIATAGCASIARFNNAKVISMDVKTFKPLGLLGYTTLDTNADSLRYNNKLSLSEWLYSVLIKKDSYQEIMSNQSRCYFDSQMKYFDNKDDVYIDCENVDEPITKYDRILKIISKAGWYKVVNFMYYRKRGIK